MSFSPRNGEIILKNIMTNLKTITAAFSPRNGEIILKAFIFRISIIFLGFQSPQWGDNSKEEAAKQAKALEAFSPRNGEIILKGTP